MSIYSTNEMCRHNDASHSPSVSHQTSTNPVKRKQCRKEENPRNLNLSVFKSETHSRDAWVLESFHERTNEREGNISLIKRLPTTIYSFPIEITC